MRICPNALAFLITGAICTQVSAQTGLEAPSETTNQSAVAVSQAPTPEDSSMFIGAVGVTEGGRALYTVQLADGSTEVVRSGALFEVGGGVLWRVPDHPLSMQLTANWHFDSAGKVSSASFSRFPLEGIAYFHPSDDSRFGLGMRYVLLPVSKATINGNEETIRFNNALGTILEGGYRVDKDTWLNLRLVWEKYQPNSCSCGGEVVSVQGSPSVNGFHVGINFVAYWNKKESLQAGPLAVREHSDWERERREHDHHDDAHEYKQKHQEETVSRNIVITPDPAK